MKEELISFETAKLAKEKGFPQPIRDGETCTYQSVNDIKYGYVDGALTMHYFLSFVCYKNVFVAPSQSLLQKWLREQHNIDIIITPFTAGKADKKRWEWLEEGKKYYYYNVHSRHGIHLDEIKDQFCNIFEEALEKALQRSLKLIDK